MVAILALSLIGCVPRPAPKPGDRAQWETYVAGADRAARYARFERYLRRRGVADVVPAWQLCRQGTDWEDARLPPFAIPPEHAWPRIVPTLRLLRDHVTPAIGPLEVVSGYRTREYNRRAGGASASRHLAFEALDLQPREADREVLHERLDALWRGAGRRRRMGLGLYAGTRFHVDTHRHRRW